jgi:hypothetical protein
MYADAHRRIAEILETLDAFSKTHEDSDQVPYIESVELRFPNDDELFGRCIDEIGGVWHFVPYTKT